MPEPIIDRRTLAKLVQYIAFEAQDRDAPILRTRLTKLLYIIELEVFRALRSRLTDLTWLRYKYGPYSFELDQVTRQLGFELQEEELDFTTGRGILVHAEEPPTPEKWLPNHVKSIADRVISRWADEDLNVLLDYVYLETEPMARASFGQNLDFSPIDPTRRPAQTDPLVSPNEASELRTILSSHGLFRSQVPTRRSGQVSSGAPSQLDEHSDSLNLQGRARTRRDSGTVTWEGRE